MRKIQKFESNLPNDQIFTSKANVLEFLQNRVKKSKIEKLLYFTIGDWKSNSRKILSNLTECFHDSKHVIIRSSAVGEDSVESSYAGAYESILNINPRSHSSLKKAIHLVILSYKKKNNVNPNNQILIQNQTLNIIISGVIFTRTPDIGAPYYVINYEEGGSTTKTTHGLSNNMIKIFRNTELTKLEKKWQLLLSSVKELELICNTDLLDIEFGLTKYGQIIIFQVRPITSIKETLPKNLDKRISKLISTNQKYFSKLIKSKSHVEGDYTIFSDMADWNPSEIIGDNPNNLDYSLYDYLIMNNAWHKGRTELYYQNINPYKLMTKFGNKPYVDVRGSFNSLIPQKLDKKLKRKLMNYYLHKLLKKPYLHDKVEFDILFTCYDISLDYRLLELRKHNFSLDEIKKIKSILLEHTNSIMNNFAQTLQKCDHLIQELTENRTEILTDLHLSRMDYQNKLSTAELLLNDCKKLGTIPFSTMARIAFIATALLNSLVKENHLDSKSVYHFIQSIDTPLSEFQKDLIFYHDKKLTLSNFLKKYGHLRPGTYDITAMRYDKQSSYFNIKFTKPSLHKGTKIEHKTIQHILTRHGLESQNDFFYFARHAIAQREFIKFAFTYNLSQAIEFITEVGDEFGLNREELANLDLISIFGYYKKLTKNQLKSLWKKKITQNKSKKQLNNFLVLPPIISSKTDFEIIKYYSAKPNYITEKSVSAELVNLANLDNIPNLENKIILLENADPGYDWIFTRNPSGLITKYGGVASHMSIRCAELGLPAAIGCGEILFEKLLFSSKVLLDCKNKEIVILEHSKHDEYIEERKMLKTLGYIK